MTYLKGLKPANLVGAAFGSYGWSGESVKHLEAILKEMQVDIVCLINFRKECSRQFCFGKMSRVGYNYRGGIEKRKQLPINGERKNIKEWKMKKYVCGVCGYVYMIRLKEIRTAALRRQRLLMIYPMIGLVLFAVRAKG